MLPEEACKVCRCLKKKWHVATETPSELSTSAGTGKPPGPDHRQACDRGVSVRWSAAERGRRHENGRGARCRGVASRPSPGASPHWGAGLRRKPKGLRGRRPAGRVGSRSFGVGQSSLHFQPASTVGRFLEQLFTNRREPVRGFLRQGRPGVRQSAEQAPPRAHFGASPTEGQESTVMRCAARVNAT